MNVILNLGCWGRSENNFKMCSGLENTILDITKGSDRNKKIADYLDTHYHLFDRPLYNNVHTAIWSLQDKFSFIGDVVFDDSYFKKIEEFCIAHAKCGLFLRLDIVEE